MIHRNRQCCQRANCASATSGTLIGMHSPERIPFGKRAAPPQEITPAEAPAQQSSARAKEIRSLANKNPALETELTRLHGITAFTDRVSFEDSKNEKVIRAKIEKLLPAHLTLLDDATFNELREIDTR